MDNTHLDPGRPSSAPSDLSHDLRSLGDYRLLRRLGEGGMGAVYLGWREGQDGQVAVKVLNDQLASSQSYVDRFYREAKSGALLNHPNIVRTLGAGQDRATGKHYLVLEFVDGPSAHALLDKAGRLSVGDAVRIALDVARALEHAHSRSIVHRDIKPDNILITRSGVAKLADLGLAKRTDETSHLTATRQGFGTTHYMPYEQALNARSADGRSDVYALGATLYHLVTGAVPFAGESHLDVVEKKGLGEFPPASSVNPDAPPLLDQILARMMALHPRDRYQTASELIVDLDRSRLAAAAPSYADPELARQDPWMQACLSSGEPTRLDPDSPHKADSPSAKEDEAWVVRFLNRAGRMCKVSATTEQIAERLRKGKLPTRVEARRASQKRYQPLNLFPEFASIRPARRVPRRRAPADSPAKSPAPAPSAYLPGRWAVLLGLLALLGLLGAAAAVLYRFMTIS